MIVDQKSNKPILGAFLIDGDFDGVKLATTKKPNFLRRVIINLVFGWKWSNIKEIKDKK